MCDDTSSFRLNFIHFYFISKDKIRRNLLILAQDATTTALVALKFENADSINALFSMVRLPKQQKLHDFKHSITAVKENQ